MAVNCGRDWSNDRATSKLKGWIQRKLGCDVIGVELTDEHLEDAVTEACEYWMSRIGRVRAVDLTLTGDVEYDASLLGTDVDTVVDVYFDVEDGILSNMFRWADVQFNPFQMIYEGQGGYSAIDQYMQYREDAARIMSAERDWEWDRARRVLIISPREGDSQAVKVVYLSRCFDFDALSTYEWNLFRKYALSQAMKTLAQIRMKMSEKPGAAGSFSLDGDSLYANAEALELQVMEKMDNMIRPTGIITG